MLARMGFVRTRKPINADLNVIARQKTNAFKDGDNSINNNTTCKILYRRSVASLSSIFGFQQQFECHMIPFRKPKVTSFTSFMKSDPDAKNWVASVTRIVLPG